MHKGAKGYAMRALAALVVGWVAALGGCGMESATQVQPTAVAVAPTATSVAPTAIPPTPTFASEAPEWLPTALPDTPTPTATPAPTSIPPTATSAETSATAVPSAARGHNHPVPCPHAPPADTLTSDDPTRLAAPRLKHTGTLLPDGRVIISGGWSWGDRVELNFTDPIPIPHLDVYHPEKGWSVISPAGDNLGDSCAVMSSVVLMADGAIMVVEIGSDETEYEVAASTLDPATQLWTPLPAPSVMAGGGPLLALLRDGRVIAAGDLQFIKDDGFTYLYANESEIFDPRARQWQSAAPIDHISEASTIVALRNGGALLVHHAQSDDDKIGAEIYDPDADEWTIVSGMRGARGDPKAVALSDGRALVVGAAIGEGEHIVQAVKSSAEIYDPDTGAWTPTGDMVGARVRFSALTLLPDGRALASGGVGRGDGAELQMSTTEIYDPKTNAWTRGPDMAEPRYDHSATALPDGRVLIAGGVTIHPDTGELYPTDTSEIITVP